MTDANYSKATRFYDKACTAGVADACTASEKLNAEWAQRLREEVSIPTSGDTTPIDSPGQEAPCSENVVEVTQQGIGPFTLGMTIPQLVEVKLDGQLPETWYRHERSDILIGDNYKFMFNEDRKVGSVRISARADSPICARVGDHNVLLNSSRESAMRLKEVLGTCGEIETRIGAARMTCEGGWLEVIYGVKSIDLEIEEPAFTSAHFKPLCDVPEERRKPGLRIICP